MRKLIQKEYITKVILLFMSIIGICGYSYFVKKSYGEQNFNMFMSFVLLFLLYFTYSKNFSTNVKSQYSIISFILSFILSSIMILGIELERYSKIFWEFKNIIYVFEFTFFFFPIVYFLTSYIDNLDIKHREIKFKYLPIITFIIIFCCTFLVYLALYPGVYGYDSIYQVKRIYANWMDTHYSVLFCYLIGRID